MTTQYAQASYQEIIDLHTQSDSVSVVGIHTPCSDTPYHMLKGFWDQFKKFRYNGCSISLVPTAQLPLDPLQVSYDASEPTIDPRDVLNPILFHGCHGDDMGAILNSLYSEPVSGVTGQLFDTEIADSIEHNILRTSSGQYSVSQIFEQLYYRALTDKTWLKAHPQRGFRKFGLHPMIYSVASTVQFANIDNGDNLSPKGIVHDDDTGDASTVNTGTLGNPSNSATFFADRGYGRPYLENNSGLFAWKMGVSSSMNGFITPRLQRLGWMDTRQVSGLPASKAVSVDLGGSVGLDSEQALTNLYLQAAKNLKPVLTPKIFMGMIMLPPAYKTLQHFRLILNHSFSFAKFRGASMQYDNFGEVNKAYGYFNFSGTDADKKIVPSEPDKEDEKDGTFDRE